MDCKLLYIAIRSKDYDFITKFYDKIISDYHNHKRQEDSFYEKLAKDTMFIAVYDDYSSLEIIKFLHAITISLPHEKAPNTYINTLDPSLLCLIKNNDTEYFEFFHSIGCLKKDFLSSCLKYSRPDVFYSFLNKYDHYYE